MYINDQTYKRGDKIYRRVLMRESYWHEGKVKNAAENLFGFFSRCYESASLIVTTNLPFSEWPQVFGDERMAGALLDRLTHRVHVMEIQGESYRLKASLKKKGGDDKKN